MNFEEEIYGVEAYLEDGGIKTRFRKLTPKEILNAEIHHYETAVRDDDAKNQKNLLLGIIGYMMFNIHKKHCS